MIAYHFISRKNGKDYLRDGSEAPPDGVWLEFKGPLIMCRSGLHFCVDPFDALQYAPGEVLCQVEVGGEIIMGDNKGVCSRRKIIRRFDTTEGLRYFVRMQALSIIHLWQQDPPECIFDWLVGGDESARDAAWAAAGDTVEATTIEQRIFTGGWDATRATDGTTAQVAACDAVWATMWDATWAIMRSPAWDAAWTADGTADGTAAWAAAWAAARQDWNQLVSEAFN